MSISDTDHNAPRYTLSLVDHHTLRRLTIELVDLPYPARRYRLRINGQWARKVPEATKSEVMRQLREWWVAH
jgi:hypothetical protein